jgi:hypothetical protein
MSERGPLGRTLLLLVVLGAAIGVVGSLWRRRASTRVPQPPEPPQWPAFPPPETAVDEPTGTTSADASTDAAGWVDGSSTADAPDGFPVKAKASSGIYHVPGGRFYDRTKPDRWYASAEAAEADGYRPSKS